MMTPPLTKVSRKTRLIFAGTPEFSAVTLNHLIQLNDIYEIVAVYTQPDRPSGRGQKLTSSPVKLLAESHNIQVLQPLNFKSEHDVNAFKAFGADLMIVVAYGLLLPVSILESPRLGCLNIHASLLPKWRGAAPIQRALLAGDDQTGVCIMQMDKGLDTGDVWASAHLNILPSHTSGMLFNELADLGAKLLEETLPLVLSESTKPTPQSSELISYAKKIEKTEAPINWNQPKELILRHIMGFNPFPGATSIFNNDLLKIWTAQIVNDSLNIELNHELQQIHPITSAQNGLLLVYDKKLFITTQNGWLEILELQLAGKKRISSEIFIQNKKLTGEILS